MTKAYIKTSLFLLIFFNSFVRADLFGGDVVVLTQILMNNVKQLTHLMQILQTGKKQVELMEDIKQEILRTIEAIQTIRPFIDPSVHKDWTTIEAAIQKMQERYGTAIPSTAGYQSQQDADVSVAQAMAQYNHFFSYSKQLDEVAKQIEQSSRSVSPGAAQKITAHSQGILLKAMNQNLRAQAILIQLQAQNLALKNREDKLVAKNQLASSQEIEREIAKKKELFKLPKF